MSTAQTDRQDIARSQLWWCLASLVAALAPHVPRLSPGITACFVVLAGWRMLASAQYLPLPDRRHKALWWLKQFLALAAFFAVYIAYRGQIGRDAGVALLATLMGLKLIELQSTRDFYIVTFLAYFLVVTNFFYSQTVFTAVYMLGVVVLITATLIRFNTSPTAFSGPECLRLGGRMVLQSVPIMLVAFVLYPRIPGPLFGLPRDAYDAVTGLSDTLTLGEITRLGASDEIAFRVDFGDRVPRAADLYWRGPVLWQTDGRTWRAGAVAQGAAHPVEELAERYRYTILLEPTDETWLIGLDAVVAAGTVGRSGPDMSLHATMPVRKRLRYALESATTYRLMGITQAERAAALQLPAAGHPRTRALAEEWRAQSDTPRAIVERALAFYREDFSYTLLPAALPGDPIDGFLFDTREGFCEHFAASFVVLMRAADVPARIVTGYQGGEFNNLSDYFMIRQRDAHAWAEVHLPQEGWVRVDPTAVVAPSRLSLGIDAIAGADAPLPIFEANETALRTLRSLRAAWDAVNYQWSQWVLGYTPQRQLELLSMLGFGEADLTGMTTALALAVAAMVLLLAVFTRRERQPADQVLRDYRRFCTRLAALNLPRKAHEGPFDYAHRVSEARPDLAAQVDHITRLYAGLRYNNVLVDRVLLTRAVAGFRPAAVPARTRSNRRPSSPPD